MPPPSPAPASPLLTVNSFLSAVDEEEEYECVSVLNSHTQDVKHVVWHPNQEVRTGAGGGQTPPFPPQTLPQRWERAWRAETWSCSGSANLKARVKGSFTCAGSCLAPASFLCPPSAVGLGQLRRHGEAVPRRGGRLGVLRHAGGPRIDRVERGLRPQRRALGFLQRRQDGAHLAPVQAGQRGR